MAASGIAAALTGFMGGAAEGKKAADAQKAEDAKSALLQAQGDYYKQHAAGMAADNETKFRALDAASAAGPETAEATQRYAKGMQAWESGGRVGAEPAKPVVKRWAGQTLSQTITPEISAPTPSWGMETQVEHDAGGVASLWAKVGRGVHTLMGDDTTGWANGAGMQPKGALPTISLPN